MEAYKIQMSELSMGQERKSLVRQYLGAYKNLRVEESATIKDHLLKTPLPNNSGT